MSEKARVIELNSVLQAKRDPRLWIELKHEGMDAGSSIFVRPVSDRVCSHNSDEGGREFSFLGRSSTGEYYNITVKNDFEPDSHDEEVALGPAVGTGFTTYDIMPDFELPRSKQSA